MNLAQILPKISYISGRAALSGRQAIAPSTLSPIRAIWARISQACLRETSSILFTFSKCSASATRAYRLASILRERASRISLVLNRGNFCSRSQWRGMMFLFSRMARVLASICTVFTQISSLTLPFDYSQAWEYTPVSTSTFPFRLMLAMLSVKLLLTQSFLFLASCTQLGLQPSPLNLMAAVSSTSLAMTWPTDYPACNLRLVSSISLPMVVRMTVMGKQQFCDDPTARNSNLLEVQAQGLVRLRSVSSCFMGVSRWAIFYCKLVRWCSGRPSIMLVTLSPRKMEKILGGASWPPRRSSLPGTLIEARYSSWLDSTALSLIRANNLNNSSLWFSGLKRFLSFPLSVWQLRDQLRCLPLPLIFLNGFSCQRGTNPCLSKTSLMINILMRLWSIAFETFSNTEQNQYWLGATYLWRVLMGSPIWTSSSSVSDKICSILLQILAQQCVDSCWLRGGIAPTKVRPVWTRSSRLQQSYFDMTKNSCSRPTPINKPFDFMFRVLSKFLHCFSMKFQALRKVVLSSSASPWWFTSREGMQSTLFRGLMKSQDFQSQMKYPLAV